jgi:hypothetical protein
MLNEDELRDAILLVFANKQDLPVRTITSSTTPKKNYTTSDSDKKTIKC